MGSTTRIGAALLSAKRDQERGSVHAFTCTRWAVRTHHLRSRSCPRAHVPVSFAGSTAIPGRQQAGEPPLVAGNIRTTTVGSGRPGVSSHRADRALRVMIRPRAPRRGGGAGGTMVRGLRLPRSAAAAAAGWRDLTGKIVFPGHVVRELRLPRSAAAGRGLARSHRQDRVSRAVPRRRAGSARRRRATGRLRPRLAPCSGAAWPWRHGRDRRRLPWTPCRYRC